MIKNQIFKTALILNLLFNINNLSAIDEFDQYNVDENYEALYENNPVQLTEEELELLKQKEEEEKRRKKEEEAKKNPNNILDSDNWEITSNPYTPNSNSNSNFRGATTADFNSKGELVDPTYQSYTNQSSSINNSKIPNNQSQTATNSSGDSQLQVGSTFQDTMDNVRLDNIYNYQKESINQNIESKVLEQQQKLNSDYIDNSKNGDFNEDYYTKWSEEFESSDPLQQQVMIEAFERELEAKEIGNLMVKDATTMTDAEIKKMIDFEKNATEEEKNRAITYAASATEGKEVPLNAQINTPFSERIEKDTGQFVPNAYEGSGISANGNNNGGTVNNNSSTQTNNNGGTVNNNSSTQTSSGSSSSGSSSEGGTSSTNAKKKKEGIEVTIPTSPIEYSNLRSIIDKILIGESSAEGSPLSLPLYIATVLLTVFRDYLVVFLGLIIGLMVWQKVQGEQWGRVLTNGVGSAVMLLLSVFLTEGATNNEGNIDDMTKNTFYLVRAEREFIKIGEDLADRLWMTLIFGPKFLSEEIYLEQVKTPKAPPESVEEGFFVQRYLNKIDEIRKLANKETEVDKVSEYKKMLKLIEEWTFLQKNSFLNSIKIHPLFVQKNKKVGDISEDYKEFFNILTNHESKAITFINSIETENLKYKSEELSSEYPIFKKLPHLKDSPDIYKPAFTMISASYSKLIFDLYLKMIKTVKPSVMKDSQKAFVLTVSKFILENSININSSNIDKVFLENWKEIDPTIETEKNKYKYIEDEYDLYRTDARHAVKWIAEEQNNILQSCSFEEDREGLEQPSGFFLTPNNPIITIKETAWNENFFIPSIVDCAVKVNNFYSPRTTSTLVKDRKMLKYTLYPLLFKNTYREPSVTYPTLELLKGDLNVEGTITKLLNSITPGDKVKISIEGIYKFKLPLQLFDGFNVENNEDLEKVLTEQPDIKDTTTLVEKIIKKMDETVKKDALKSEILALMKTNPYQKEGNPNWMISWMELGGIMGALKDIYAPYIVMNLASTDHLMKAQGDVAFLSENVNEHSQAAKADSMARAAATIAVIKGLLDTINAFTEPTGVSKIMKGFGVWFLAGWQLIKTLGSIGLYIIMGHIILISILNLLPAIIWMLAVLSWYVKTAVILAVIPLATFMLSFVNFQQIKTMILTLVALMLTPVVLVSMFFILMEILSLLPLLIEKFLPMLGSAGAFLSLDDESLTGGMLNGTIGVGIFGFLDDMLQITFLIKLFIELVISTILYSYFLRSSEYIQMVIGHSVSIGDETKEALGKVQQSFKMGV